MGAFGDWVERKLGAAVKAVLPQSVKDRLIRHYSIPNVRWSLQNAKKNGFHPTAIVDVGAYKGEWTRMATQIFPKAEILAVEPQGEKKRRLERLSRSHPNVQFAGVLLGREDGDTVTFHLNEMVSSVLREYESSPPETETRTVSTFDTMTEDTPFAQPDLLKLDVQGFELEVLRGAERTLKAHPPELILMEVSLIEINQGAPLFAEVVDFLDRESYRLYDICSFMRRPYDDALWQIDALFAHETSSLIASRRWE